MAAALGLVPLIGNVNLFAIIISAAALFIATVTDLKSREVPDYLSIGLMIFAGAYAIVLAFIEGSFWPIINSALGGIVFFGLGALLYYTGQWGGGDAKLITGIGMLNGFFIHNFLLTVQNSFIIEFLLALVIAGGVYGISALVYLAIRNWKPFVDHYRKMGKQNMHFSIIALVILAILMVASAFMGLLYKVLMYTLILMVGLMYFGWKVSKVVEDVSLIKEVSPNKLTEGDWVAEDVFYNKKLIVSKKNPGLTKEQISQLKKLFKNKKVKIKEGIPFVPSFLLAYILLLLI